MACLSSLLVSGPLVHSELYVGVKGLGSGGELPMLHYHFYYLFIVGTAMSIFHNILRWIKCINDGTALRRVPTTNPQSEAEIP